MNNTLDVRMVHPRDEEAISKAYDAFVSGNKAKSWFKHIDKEASLNVLFTMSFIINETYLVIISKERPWYFGGEKSVIVEQLIAKIYPKGKGTFTDVLDFLKQEAKSRGCVAVFAGSMLASQYKQMARLYEQGGFKEEGAEYVLELE